MKNFNSYRVFEKNKVATNTEGAYVIYWMQANRRLHHNYALEYAVAWANKLELPLLVYEALNADYEWNTARTHQFMMQGMEENRKALESLGIAHFSFVEKKAGEGKGLLRNLCAKAALLISDEYPVFINQQLNERVATKLDCKFITVDANGLIPMRLTTKDPYSAYIFRKTMHKHFAEAVVHSPKENPLDELERKLPAVKLLDASFYESYEYADGRLSNIPEFLETLSFDNEAKPIEMIGTRVEALKRLDNFLERRLKRYHSHRNHPDTPSASGLSPWLHFGKISAHEIVHRILEMEDWEPSKLKPVNGKNEGFFGLSEATESFFDEVITWREVGFHYAHHRPDYDQFSSLPDWALKTMDEHRHDERKYIYSYEQLANAQTHDEIWNAAQRQLKEEGIVHNYLRMLWGKKVIEWTPDYETALSYLIDLNNIYAIDGRDPNSYSGIFWCFGRFDRAWQERSVFGKLRYMASENTFKKIKMKGYMKRWGKTALGL